MKEIPFSIAISGVVRMMEDSLIITVNQTETVVRMQAETTGKERSSFGEGRNMFDVILETSQDLVREKGSNRLRAAEIYHKAMERYPQLKRNSFVGHVIASAADHPSYKHFSARRNYFSYSSGGVYELNREYIPKGINAF